MAYIAAQKANNELWGLITGNLLSGYPLATENATDNRSI